MADFCNEQGFSVPLLHDGVQCGEPEDSEKSPFVHRFQTRRHKYVYDVNTRRILRVSDVVWGVISDVGRLDDQQIIARHAAAYGREQVAAALEQIALSRREKGLFLSCRPDKILPAEKEQVEERLRRQREQLILNITECCNFRCGYCVYGGSYEHYREHSAKHMLWEVARPAIDEFLAHSEAASDRVISFYGGEPLLNLPLIRQSVQYVRDASANPPVRFTIVTNGFLLDRAAADFLAENDFTVVVSLDGPQEIHDRGRKTASGDATWARVTANVRDFADSHPSYRTNGRLRFNAVADANTDLCQVQAFFASSDLFADSMGLEISEQKGLSDPGSLRATDPLATSAEILRAKLFDDLKAGRFGSRRSHRENWVEVSALEKPLLLFHKRGFLATPLPKTLALLNTCIPGARRTFVSVGGDYFACERVVECAEERIGNVWTGMDAAKVLSLLERWTQASGGECRSCWCLPTCTVGCFASVGNDGAVTPAAKREACELCRDRAHRLLVVYTHILEENPQAMDYADEITLS